MIRNHEDLFVWQKAMDLVFLIYESTKSFPKEETYCLTSQMRRAAISIPSNIAEGRRRGGRDFQRFLRIAFGSTSELDTQLEIARHLRYISNEDFLKIRNILIEVSKMLNKMTQGDLSFSS